MDKSEIPPEPPKVAEVLRRHFLRLDGVTQERLGEALGVSRHSVNELMNGRRAVTAVMALRLARVLGTDPEFWMNLQQNWDLHQARRDHGAAIEKLKMLRAEQGFDEVARPFDEVFRGDSPEAKPPRRAAIR
jgi:addiction module HigA family antidote